MFNKILLSLSILVVVSQSAFAEMMLFVNDDCEYCNHLELQLQAQDLYETRGIDRYEISNEDNLKIYLDTAQKVGYTSGGVPLLVDGEIFVEGKDPILSYLKAGPLDENTANVLGSENSEDLNQIIEDIVKNPQNPRGQFSEDGAVASIDFFSLTLLALILLAISSFIYYLYSRGKR